MAKPPDTPPNSDINGVHEDGTRPSKKLPPHGDDNQDLKRAYDENVARPDYSDEESSDDRTG